MSGHGELPAKKLAFVDPATFTPHFSWKKSNKADRHAGSAEAVLCEGIRLVDVADKIGTPAYVYSRAVIDDAQAELHRGLGSLPHTLCFAVKSNGNLAILKHIAKTGNGFDIVSGGELEMLRTALFFPASVKRAKRFARRFSIASQGRERANAIATGAASCCSTSNRKRSSKFYSKKHREPFRAVVACPEFRFA